MKMKNFNNLIKWSSKLSKAIDKQIEANPNDTGISPRVYGVKDNLDRLLAHIKEGDLSDEQSK